MSLQVAHTPREGSPQMISHHFPPFSLFFTSPGFLAAAPFHPMPSFVVLSVSACFAEGLWCVPRSRRL